ncbi:MAG: PilZ domain-containing protein [Acidobacteria bacterium]|nr:PilZ domain-containing protein [Acidobacteriota bacterium]
MDKRPEPRVPADIPVRIWGMDADGRPFFQNAIASNVSSDGAQLSRLNHPLKIGDIIGIQFEDKKARFQIKWVKSLGLPRSMSAGVWVLPNQTVPWAQMAAAASQSLAASKGSERRRFARHNISFPITISFPHGARAHMQCSATDIGGRGCYVETLVPLATGTQIIVSLWIDSEKVTCKGVVRASDPGVGMGIEFLDLQMEIQQRLQEYLDKIDKGFASAASQNG